MRIQETPVQGVKVVLPDLFEDERGYFARTWGKDVFADQGLVAAMVQRNLSFNAATGTLRGMHFQRAPFGEVKVVSCMIGAIYDVALDIRPDSPTFGRWYGAELTAQNGAMLYVPEGCAHGYLTLEPGSLVEYLISEFYHPEVSGGIRWDDPFFAVDWPAEPTTMNERDRTWPDFEAARVMAQA